jgi:hypothetical protein
MADELTELRAEVAELRRQLDTLRQGGTPLPVNGIAVKTSDLMNGFQSALAKSMQARQASEGGANIRDYVIKNLEIEFAAPLVAEREGDEPILMVPNVKNVTTDSPLVRLKFSVSHVPPKGEAE